jgi:hypothetical protein
MYAAAGALAGFGKGVEEVAMAKLKAQYVADQRATDLAGDKELATYKDSLADGNKVASGGGGGGGRRSSGGGSSSSSTSTPAAGGGPLKYVQPDADGNLVGQDKAGNWVPAKGPDGEPIKVPPKAAKGAKDSKDPLGSGTVVEPGTTPQRPADPSPARPAPPKAGDVVGGHKFKGGAVNDEKNWEPVSSVSGGPERVVKAGGTDGGGGQVSNAYDGAVKALDKAMNNPTDESIYMSQGAIDKFIGELQRVYGGNIPPEWLDRLKAFDQFLPKPDGSPDYSGYKWKNWPIGVGV